jgi:hypothetical protein
MRDRAECRASLELRRYRASHGYWWEFSEHPGRCQISPAHAAGRGGGGGFGQVYRSTLPGPIHANRQTKKAGWCANHGGHPKPPPVETAAVMAQAFPAMLERCSAIKPFSF